MNRRNRKPAPELAPQSLYVRAPRLIRDWIGRRVVFHAGAETGLAKFPPTMIWTVTGITNRPRGCVHLAADACACCGVAPRCNAHTANLRLPKVAGWLPLPLKTERDKVVLVKPETTYGTDPTPAFDASTWPRDPANGYLLCTFDRPRPKDRPADERWAHETATCTHAGEYRDSFQCLACDARWSEELPE